MIVVITTTTTTTTTHITTSPLLKAYSPRGPFRSQYSTPEASLMDALGFLCWMDFIFHNSLREACALLRCYIALICSLLPTFWVKHFKSEYGSVHYTNTLYPLILTSADASYCWLCSKLFSLKISWFILRLNSVSFAVFPTNFISGLVLFLQCPRFTVVL